MSGKLSGTLALDNSQFLAKLVESGQVGDREAKKIARALEYATTEIRKMAAAQKAANDAAGSSDKAAASIAKIGQAAQVSAGQIANANRMLPAQFTDIVTQLAGGQNPALILIQQGGQIRDAYGGIIPALRGVAGALNPVTLAALVATGAIGSLAYAFFEGQQQSKAFTASLQLTQNAAGQTADSFQLVIDRAAKATTASTGAAREAAQLLVSSGQFNPATLGPATEALLRYKKLSGDSAEEVAKKFTQLADSPVKAALELNKQLNFLTATQYASIKAAEEMGQKQRAVVIVLDGLNGRLPVTAGFWDDVKKRAGDAWDAMAGNGREKTVADRIAEIDEKLARAGKPQFTGAYSATTPNISEGQRDSLREQRRLLLLSQQRQATDALAQAEAARVQKAGIAAQELIDKALDETKAQQTLTKEVERYEKAFAAAAAAGKAYSAEDQAKVLEAVRKKLTPDTSAYKSLLDDLQRYEQQTNMLGKAVKAEGEVEAWAAEQRKKVTDSAGKMSASEKTLATAAINAAEARRIATLREMEARDRLVKSVQAQIALDQAQYARVTGLLSAGDDLAKGYIEQGREIGLTAEQLERLNTERQLELQLQKALVGVTNGEEADAVYAAARRNGENARRELQRLQDARKSFESNAGNGVRAALRDYLADVEKRATATQRIVAGTLKASEDAFIQWAKTGKLSVRDVFSYAAEQYLRMQFQSGAAGLIKAGGGSDNFSFATLLNAAGSFFGFGKASGMEYVPYDGYPAVLHEGEKVLTKAEARDSRGGASMIDASVKVGSVGAGVSRGEMYAAIRQAQAAQSQRLDRRNFETGNA